MTTSSKRQFGTYVLLGRFNIGSGHGFLRKAGGFVADLPVVFMVDASTIRRYRYPGSERIAVQIAVEASQVEHSTCVIHLALRALSAGFAIDSEPELQGAKQAQSVSRSSCLDD